MRARAATLPITMMLFVGLAACRRDLHQAQNGRAHEAWLEDRRQAEALVPETIQSLRKATSFEILSIDPPYKDLEGVPGQPKVPATIPFHQWKEFGRTSLSDPVAGPILASMLEQGFRRSDRVSLCMFNPRHAVRVHAEGRSDLDLVICFQCRQLAVFQEEHDLFWMDFIDETDLSVEELLNHILDEAHIPRHDPALDQKQIEVWRKKFPDAFEKK